MRDDGQRCCFPNRSPCRWLSSFVCFQCCQDGADVYAGDLQDQPDGEARRPYNLEAAHDRLIGSVIQPIFGGYCNPELQIKTADSAVPYAKMTGPCFFGGWSECCCDFRFLLTTFSNKETQGDLGVITKKKPQSLAGAFHELMSEADVYTIEFGNTVPNSSSHTSMTASQKATALASQLLVDYMIFEGNTEKCFEDENAWYCVLSICCHS